MKKFFVLTLLLSFISIPSHALLEFRALGGASFIDPQGMNQYLKSQGIQEMYLVGNVGADATLIIPMTGIGLGVRYDWQGVKVNAAGSGGEEAEVSVTRLAATFRYRFVSDMAYAGIIGVFGINHTPKAKLVTSVSGALDYDKGTANSVSGGVEAGFMLGPILMGAEGGFQSYLVRDLKGPSGNASFDINLGAFYVLATAGLGF